MTDKAHSLARDELVRVLTSYTGITTSDGAEGGTTLIDSGLVGRNDFITEKTILIMSGDAKDEDKGAASFDPDTGTITLQGTGFSAQIKAGTIFRVLNISTTEIDVANINTKIGTPTDGGAAATLFGRHKKLVTAVHAHLLLVVHDTSSLDANLDTPLENLLEEFGFEVLVADPADVDGELELNFDGVVVSASCVDADKTKLADLKYVDCPVVCHSAEIAVSTVFNLGATAGTRAAQTDIEITVNTTQWFLDQAIGDLTVTTAATIYTIGTKGANAVTLAEEVVASTDITCLVLFQGQEDDGAVPYAPGFDRVFFGLGDAGKANDTAKAIYFSLYEHLLHEKRFSPEIVVTPKRVYQEQIPDTAISIAPDTATADPPGADSENSVVDIDKKQNRTFVLRSLFINISALGGGTATMTFKLWVDIGGTPTQVDSVDVTSTGYQNLVDIFGLQEVHADSIHITATVDADTGTIAGIYRYAEAKK